MKWRLTDQEVDKKTWTEIVEEDCLLRKLNREDAMDRIRWMKQRGRLMTTVDVSG